MQGDLSALIKRVEKATGPDRRIDAEILCAFHGYVMHEESDPANGIFAFWDGKPWESTCHNCTIWPKVTASLDAALALVEEKLPDCDWECTTARHRKGFMAAVWYAEVFRADATTPALAIVLALLRALQSLQADRSPSPAEVKDAG